MPNAGREIDNIRESSTGEYGSRQTQQTQRESEGPISEPSTGDEPSLTDRLLHAFSPNGIDNDHNNQSTESARTASRSLFRREEEEWHSSAYIRPGTTTNWRTREIRDVLRSMLVASYMINFITTFSLSAIASNGTVRGGGAYYLISRSLGPEFGGSIGLVFYLGFVFNTGMNAVGLIDCITLNFGADGGNWAQILPETKWYCYLWATVILVLCTLVCLAGSGIFARASNGLLVVLFFATLSIPLSALVVRPFESRKLGIEYTGISLQTLAGNLLPKLTKGAAGSQINGKETFQDLFGILFPATGGIFAGASMSGDLKSPSKAIPKGTLYGLVTTFFFFVTMTYLMTFLVMNLACFLLSIGSAPNWRPSFHFFNWQTAFAGAIVSGAAMFFVDGLYATGCVGILLLIFLLIHYSVEPKSWGDVSQSLIYHQIRKYLLKLKQEHVKFWRPQVILLVNDPRRQYKLIQFCNSMKKGGLYILGHIIVTDDFSQSVPEARRQQAAWNKYIDFSKIKAFVNIAIYLQP
ncbi:hypothetical protein EYC84_004392 [Monilinia fructicola]|uniref:Amino acid permease/ SLC12A domain-containing protein n=1 Tax=Monilinia fructicola TaxID=38448 RepID=A0A5M9K8J9_MONFR|nr:hypothetical protein EYC84_004392 [Monilinia fructicola]